MARSASAFILLAFAFGRGAPAATPPAPLATPYQGPLFRILGGGCVGTFSDAQLQQIVEKWGFVNSHATIGAENFWPDAACGVDGNGDSLRDRIKALNPDFTFSNYRNGSYVQQHRVEEAAQAETGFPLSIAVWKTPAVTIGAIGASDTAIQLQRGATPPSGMPAHYPFKPSSPGQGQYTSDVDHYVSWIRLEDEILRVDTATWNGSTIDMTVQRGIWGTTAASHASGTAVMAPVYIGSVTSGADTSLSGIPDNTSGQMGIRYAFQQGELDFQTWLGDKSQHYFDHGMDVVWLDVTSPRWYNNGNAYGVPVTPWDYPTNAALTNAVYLARQQSKLDALFARFPTGKFLVNRQDASSYMNEDRRLLSGENQSGVVAHTPASGGAMEFYANVNNATAWRNELDMTLDMVRSGFWGIAWAKGSSTATYMQFAYGTFLMAHEPDDRVVFGGEWSGGLTATPQAFIYYDLGVPLQHFNNAAEAQTATAGVYQRIFSKGRVLVNVGGGPRDFALNEELYDPETNAFTISVSMANLTARILLKAEGDLYEPPLVVEEDFAFSAWTVIDNQDSPEAILRLPGSGFAWGAISAASLAPGAIGGIAQGLVFKTEALVAGSCAYTRFNTTTAPPGAGAYSPSVIVDCSHPDSAITLTMAPAVAAPDASHYPDLAVLIRDDAGWWQSASQTIDDFEASYIYALAGAEAGGWIQADMSSPGAIDMDQVDDGGEQPCALAGAGTPNFSAIQGMGIVCASSLTGGGGEITIDKMRLEAPAPLASAHRSWRRFR